MPAVSDGTGVDHNTWGVGQWGKEGKLGTYAMKRVAAGAHFPTPWLFEPAKLSYNRADYCLSCSFLFYCKHQVLVLTFEWSVARPMGEQW